MCPFFMIAGPATSNAVQLSKESHQRKKDTLIYYIVSAQKAEKHVKVQLRSAFRLFESKVLGLISPKTLHYC